MRTKPPAILLLTLLSACGGQTSANTRAASEGQATETSPVPLPDPAVYAAELDAKERYWWQQPEAVVEMLACAPGMTIVDLGAGPGYFIPYLSRAVGPSGRVYALDVDPTMVEHLVRRVAQERLHNVTPVLVPPENPSLSPRAADRVLVVNTWHHLTDRVAYAKHLREALRPGGQVLVVDFDANSPEGPPAAHRLSPETVVGELRAAGFAVAQLEESLPYQYAIGGTVP